jgi:hypothetical protein
LRSSQQLNVGGFPVVTFADKVELAESTSFETDVDHCVEETAKSVDPE